MKLQRQLSKKIGDIEYDKWVVIIPPEKIKELGWKAGTELDVFIKDGKLVLKNR